MIKKTKIICLCSSASFFKQVVIIGQELEGKYRVLYPKTALSMKRKGDFNVEKVKPWHKNAKDFEKKTKLTSGHFKKVARSDAILVVNYDKKGTQNYIGGATLMEMGLAFYLRKKIFVLNRPQKDSILYEEIMALKPVFLGGDLDKVDLK